MPPSETHVLILAPMQRSGTNFITDLLCLHPDCERPPAVGEDFVLHEAHHLERYVDRVLVHWRKHLAPDVQVRKRQALAADLGRIALAHLFDDREASSDRAPYRVTRTPSVQNIELLKQVFPAVKPIIIVRHGRDSVFSAMRSFDRSFKKSVLGWRRASRDILNFLNSPEGKDALLVRYEDLFVDSRRQIARICEYLGLDPARMDFEAAENLPVRGSSDLRKKPTDPMHWGPVEKTSAFNPIARWHEWSAARQNQFLSWAGPELVALGYEQRDALPAPTLSNRIAAFVRNLRFSVSLRRRNRRRWRKRD